MVVHGQSDQIRLKSQTAQRDALDRFAGSAVQAVLGEYQQAYRHWQAAREELDRLIAERDDRAREAEELRAAIEEIEASAPDRGEDTALAERAERLSNLEDLRVAAVTAHRALSDDDTSTDGMRCRRARRAGAARAGPGRRSRSRPRAGRRSPRRGVLPAGGCCRAALRIPRLPRR